ncbi:ATP-binding response regulator [Hydrogenophaga sp.]|uniref:ATP-binding response regulator n=1 Tax=Hydrogenophaga sp. TaxID=1904254 RepID=UPI003F6A5D83
MTIADTTGIDGREALMELDRIKALKVALDSSFRSNLAVGLLLSAVLLALYPWSAVLAWLCGLLLVQRHRRLLKLFSPRTDAPQPQTRSAHNGISARRFEADSFFLALYWGATALWFFDAQRAEVQLVVAHALGGVSLVSLGVHAYNPGVMRWFVLTVNLPFIVRCYLQLDLHHAYVGTGMLLMSAYLLVFGRHLSKVVRQAIELKYENTDLVAELKTQTVQLQRANETKSRFLAAASHDLRQPVHAVGLLAAALEGRTKEPDHKNLVHKMQAGLLNFSDVIDEILDVARLDAGQVPLEIQSVALSPLIERIDATFREIALAKHLALFTRMPCNRDACVMADPALLWRVLANLVSNALRYTESGAVLIAVRPAGKLHANRPGARCSAWRIEVRDSGPGIAPALQANVFEEFFQIANEQRKSQQGLGLGLSMAQRMSHLMGAELMLRSKPGMGSVFSVTLRCSTLAHTGLDSPAEADPDRAQGKVTGLRVLLVDDDPNAREAFETLLHSWQIEVRTVATPEQACEQVREGFTPQVLITDHRLGGGHDAFSSARLIKEHMQALKMPEPMVAVFTGDITSATRQQIQAQGWHFASKPVRPPGLLLWLRAQALNCTAQSGQ